MKQERVDASNARVAARRNPAKNRSLLAVLIMVLAGSIGFAVWSAVVLSDSRAVYAHAVEFNAPNNLGLGSGFGRQPDKPGR
jgi:hypothetical protein